MSNFPKWFNALNTTGTILLFFAALIFSFTHYYPFGRCITIIGISCYLFALYNEHDEEDQKRFRILFPIGIALCWILLLVIFPSSNSTELTVRSGTSADTVNLSPAKDTAKSQKHFEVSKPKHGIITFTNESLPSESPETPYQLVVKIMTAKRLNPVHLRITCDKDIASASFESPKSGSMAIDTDEWHGNIYDIAFVSYGTGFEPNNPVFAHIEAKERIKAIKVEQMTNTRRLRFNPPRPEKTKLKPKEPPKKDSSETPSIVVGPGGVVSMNQQGGITAGQIGTVIITEPTQRSIDENRFSQELSRYAGTKVFITYGSDLEAQALANQLIQSLKVAKWVVLSAQVQSAYAGGSDVDKGVWVETPEKLSPSDPVFGKAKLILYLLNESHIKAVTFPSDEFLQKTDLIIHVGSRS